MAPFSLPLDIDRAACILVLVQRPLGNGLRETKRARPVLLPLRAGLTTPERWLMSKSIDEVFAPGGAGGLEFADKALKARLVGEKIGFRLIGARTKYVSQFGERTSFDVTLPAAAGGGDYCLDFGHTESRQTQAEAVLAVIAGGKPYVDGVFYLVQVDTKAGNKFLAIQNEPGEGDYVPTDMDDAAPAAAAGADEDLPF